MFLSNIKFWRFIIYLLAIKALVFSYFCFSSFYTAVVVLYLLTSIILFSLSPLSMTSSAFVLAWSYSFALLIFQLPPSRSN